MEKKKQERNPIFLFFSILAALLVWLYVDTYNNTMVTTQIRAVPVVFLNENTTLAKRGMMVVDGREETVDLTLRGKRWAIATLRPEEVLLQVDLGNVTATGKQELTYKIQYPNAMNDISVEAASDSTVSVTIGNLCRKKVPIHVEVKGEPAEGYQVGELSIQPKELELHGQQEDLDQISYALVNLQLNHATTDLVQWLGYQLYDTSGHVWQEEGSINGTVDAIHLILKIQQVKEIPLEVVFQESTGSRMSDLVYRLSPETITLCGAADVLESWEKLTLDTIDLQDVSSETLFRSYDLTYLIEDCTLMSEESIATLSYAIPTMTEKTYSVQQIHYENAGDAQTAEILSQQVEVTLRGTETALATISAEQLEAVVDLSDYQTAEGIQTLTVRLHLPENCAVDVKKLGTVTVKLLQNPEN